MSGASVDPRSAERIEGGRQLHDKRRSLRSPHRKATLEESCDSPVLVKTRVFVALIARKVYRIPVNKRPSLFSDLITNQTLSL